MTRSGSRTLCVALLFWAGLAAAADLSDAVRAQRPKGGEYFGLYLIDKKVGYVFTDLSPAPGDPSKVRAVTEMVFKASFGDKTAERRHKEVRVYESKPGGRLLTFTVEQSGDGGKQTLIGTSTPNG